MQQGLAGNIAKLFLDGKLTILLMGAFLIIGVYSSTLIPREEEPQIDVPIAEAKVAAVKALQSVGAYSLVP